MEKAIEVKICTLDVLVAIEMSLFLSDLVNSIYESVSCSVTCDPLQTHGLQPSRLLCPWNSPCKNTGVGCHFLLQGICPIQGSNPHLSHCRQILKPLAIININNAAINFLYQFLWEYTFSLPLGIYVGSRIAGSCVQET